MSSHYKICCELLIAIFLPPLGVCLRRGCCSVEFFICLLLTILECIYVEFPSSTYHARMGNHHRDFCLHLTLNILFLYFFIVGHTLLSSAPKDRIASRYTGPEVDAMFESTDVDDLEKSLVSLGNLFGFLFSFFPILVEMKRKCIRGPPYKVHGKVMLRFADNPFSKIGVRFDKPVPYFVDLRNICEPGYGFFCNAGVGWLGSAALLACCKAAGGSSRPGERQQSETGEI
ncbi:hypothetical protein REPUB_Repub04eG0193200 [Reevesia pubescens]